MIKSGWLNGKQKWKCRIKKKAQDARYKDLHREEILARNRIADAKRREDHNYRRYHAVYNIGWYHRKKKERYGDSGFALREDGEARRPNGSGAATR